MDEKFKLLMHKEVYELLQGDGNTLLEYKGEEYKMPYCTATNLMQICKDFGISTIPVGSRWNIVEELFRFAIDNNRIEELLNLFFNEKRFDNLRSIGNIDEIDNVYNEIVTNAIQCINKIIILSKNELIHTNGHFYMIEIGKSTNIETPKFNYYTIPYVYSLRERCEQDLLSKNYDSVITKSRTMIEEVLVQILEKNQCSNIPKGDIIKMYNVVKKLYGMNQSKGYDGRVNSLLDGLERIVQSVAEMRNANSDAHGVGSRRINIQGCEARLVMNASITFCEYILSVHERKQEVIN